MSRPVRRGASRHSSSRSARARSAPYAPSLASGAKVDDTILGSGPAGRRYDPADSGAAAKAGAAIKGPSALMLAVSNAHFELASLLLDAGADPNFAPQGWTALHELSWVRKPGVGSNSPTPPGSGTIDSTELIKRLAAHGANLNARASGRRKEVLMTHLNLNGGTPFFFASRTCDTELMRLLVELGADPKLRNEDDTTPLMAAAGLGTRSTGEDAGTEPECVEAVKLTLELGNDINAVDDYGNTAMHGAAIKQMPSVVKLLAERGAKIDIWNRGKCHGLDAVADCRRRLSRAEFQVRRADDQGDSGTDDRGWRIDEARGGEHDHQRASPEVGASGSHRALAGAESSRGFGLFLDYENLKSEV